MIDREQVADLGLDLAGVGRELGTLLGGALRQPVQLLRPQLQGHPADRRRRTAPRVGPLLDLKIKTPSGELVPVSTFTRIEIEHGAAHAEPLPAAQRGAGVRRRRSRASPRRRACASSKTPRRRPRRPGVVLDYAGESRQIRREGSALTVTLGLRRRAHLPGARRAVPELPRPADRAARLGAARDLGRAGLQLPRPHHDQHLLAGRADHAGRADREERHPDRASSPTRCRSAGLAKAGRAARGGARRGCGRCS